MPGNTQPLLSIGALLLGLAAICLEPGRDFVLRKTAEYDLHLPSFVLARPSPVVFDEARDIRYTGSHSSAGVELFQNIFYAEDTSGVNRFAPPVPVRPARGTVIDATQSGAWCPQATGDVLPFTSRVTNVSENCLSLRIARPRGTQVGAGLPVMVWLHGGGHALGSGSEVLYEPDGLVRLAAADGQPLIFVAINYRLGFFGFATSEGLVKAKHTNAGLRDQREALEWVRDNIASFGGDPARVTAIGQSVGASDISLQLTAFGGVHGVPFQQAIMMSGGPGLNFNTKSDLVANNTAAVAREAGCISPDGNGQSQQDILKCLRQAPAGLLTNLSVSAARAQRPPFGEGFFFPTYDGDFVPDRPSQLVRAGKVGAEDLPVIAAWVTNDGAWYAPPTTAGDEDVLASFGLWLHGLSAATKRKLLELYPLEDFEHMATAVGAGVSPQYYRAAQMNRDLWFTCPVLDFAWQYARLGGRGGGGGHVRLYEHNATRYGPSFEMMGVPFWRVAHLSDIPYVLNVQRLGGGADNSAPQLATAREVSRAISRFVSAGNSDETWPTAFAGTDEQEWAADSPSRVSLQVFGGPHGGERVTTRRGYTAATQAEEAIEWEKLFERCDFINSATVREETGV